MKFLRGETIFIIIILLFLIPMLGATYNWPFSASVFPLVVGTPTLLLLIFLFVTEILKISRGVHKQPATQTRIVDISEEYRPAGVVVRRALPTVVGILGLVVAAWVLGFTIAIPLFTFIYMKVVGRESWWLSLGFTIVMGAFVFFLLDKTLRIGWPHSLLGG